MNSCQNPRCDQCPLVVPCLAHDGLEIRVCNVCRGAFYGEKTQEDDFWAEAKGRPLAWGKHARPIEDGFGIPCFCAQLAAYQSRMAKYKHSWRCKTCSFLKFTSIEFKLDLGSEPHIVTEPVKLHTQVCGKETK
jgi:hypothetical protein